MITGLRSALLCEKMEQTEAGNMNCLGLIGDTLSAESRPGIVDPWLLVQVETDGDDTTGVLRVQAEGYDEQFPFQSPAGVRLTGAALPLTLPVLRDGPLVVTVTDAARKAKSWKVRWRLRFAKDPKILDDEAGRSFARAGAEAAAILRAGVGQRH